MLIATSLKLRYGNNKLIRSSRPRKSKPRSSGRSKTLSKNKVVIRRLPPLLPESQFLESVKQWVNENTTDHFKFYPGRVSKSKNKECIYSRAYIHFKNIEQVLEFHRVYDNHLFRDKQAEEAQQNAFKEPSATLEGGATQLERLENRLASAAASNAPEKPKTTPLIEYLRAQKSEIVKDNNNSDQKIDKVGDDATTKPTTIKAETNESKEKEPIRNSAVKITIQQRQKDQIRQIIQRPVKKEDKESTIETKEPNNSFDNNNNNFEVKENTSETKKNEVPNKEITSATTSTATINSSTRSSTTSYSNSPYSSHRNRRDKRRNYSFDNKPHHGQIQILTKPQSQQQTPATNTSNATTDSATASSSPASSSTAKTSATSQENSNKDNDNNNIKAETSQSTSSNSSSSASNHQQHSNNVSPPINRRGRGYYSRRGRW
ncbi:12454_t:CDS:2 [Entrophospora sp. SA101]|nr:12454_t:CDS:2 [Entrophospora sp. SA101]